MRIEEDRPPSARPSVLGSLPASEVIVMVSVGVWMELDSLEWSNALRRFSSAVPLHCAVRCDCELL